MTSSGCSASTPGSPPTSWRWHAGSPSGGAAPWPTCCATPCPAAPWTSSGARPQRAGSRPLSARQHRPRRRRRRGRATARRARPWSRRWPPVAARWRPLPDEDPAARIGELVRVALDGDRDVLVVVPDPVSPVADAVVETAGDLAVDARHKASDRVTYRRWLQARTGQARVVVGGRGVALWPLGRPSCWTRRIRPTRSCARHAITPGRSPWSAPAGLGGWDCWSARWPRRRPGDCCASSARHPSLGSATWRSRPHRR